MEDEGKSRKQLLRELAQLRRKVAELETSQAARKRAEEALGASEERLRAFMRWAPDGFFLYDSELNLVEMNEAGLRMFPPGSRKEDLIGKNAKDLSPDFERTDRYGRYQEVLRTGEPFRIDEFVPHPRFGDVYMAVTAFKVGSRLGLIVRDITARKRAEEALASYREGLEELVAERTSRLMEASARLEQELAERKQAEERIHDLARLPSENPNPVLRVSLDGDVVYANQAGRVLLESWGRQAGQALPQEWLQALQGTLQNESPTILEFGFGDQTFSFTFAPVARRDYINVYGLDITERKQAEEALREYSERLVEMVEERTRELREAREELVRSEKLALLGEVAGAMGHELRNPLGAIKNAVYYLNMVLEKPDPEVRDTLDILNLEAGNCARIVQDLLDFARSRPPVHVQIQVNDTVRGALSDIPVPEGVEVVAELDEGLPPILADAIQLNQVFGNIITNAFQAMPEGGRLLVRSRAAEGEGVAISFADTGVGIPEENLGRMFEPLFTTKARGIGLGLAAVRLLVERHGGKVEVESEPGRGSTFTVWLPVGGASDRPAPGADA